MASLVVGSRWAALGASAVVITACGGGGSSDSTPPAKKRASASVNKPKPAATRPPGDHAQLVTLLTNRAKAIELGDAQDYVETATGGQVAKDRRAIATAAKLPIAQVRLTAQGIEIDDDRATMRVDMGYTFEDIETEYIKTSRMSAVKTPEGWRIERDRPSAGAVAPWEHTRYKARTSDHFLALAPSRLKVGSLMTDLEKGRQRMRRGLPGVKLPDRVLVIVNRNSNDTKALTKDYKTLSAITAVAEAQVATEGPARRVSAVGSQRIFVLWRSYGNRNAGERRMVIAHELVHIALAKRAGGRVPAWLSEGIAMYASGDKRYGEAGALLSGGRLRDQSKQQASENALSLTRLAKPTSLDNMSAIPLSFAYSYSSAAAYAIAEKHGSRALLRLYNAYNSEKLKGRPGRKLSDKVMRKVLKKSLTTVEQEVDAYARARSSL